MKEKNTSRVEIKPDNCKCCMLCINNCPVKVLELSEHLNKSGYHYAQYKGQGCTGCLACYYSCPEPDAITVFRE